mmetsp:Transcript_7913/g.19476  ORF Transcript_7913/g.19476 Transcript_7913/m.19476 type:complete len:187 (+) Transcript_7913:51-611(+)
MRALAVFAIAVTAEDPAAPEAGDIGSWTESGGDYDTNDAFEFGDADHGFPSKAEACSACFGGFNKQSLPECTCYARQRTPDAATWHTVCGDSFAVGSMYESCWDDDPAPACEGISWVPEKNKCSAGSFTKNELSKGADWQSCMKMCCANQDCNVFQMVNGVCYSGFATERDCTGEYLSVGMRKVEA